MSGLVSGRFANLKEYYPEGTHKSGIFLLTLAA